MNDAQLRSMITMGKVAGTKIGPHTLMQITGLDGVSQQTVLLLPPGYSARPLPGSDLALLQVLGSGDHVIALGGAQENHVVADLAPGECGLTAFNNQLVMRTDHVEITGTGSANLVANFAGGAITLNAPTTLILGDIDISGTLTAAGETIGHTLDGGSF
jgi:phage gp45-like